MTRDEAVAAIQTLFQAYAPDGKTKGLSPKNVGAFTVGPEAFYFEYVPDAGTLAVMALVYRFRAKPRPAVLEAFREVAKSEDQGGGKLEYQAPSKSVLLSRTYASAPAPSQLKKDTDRLANAAQRWRVQVVPKVAEQASSKKKQFLK